MQAKASTVEQASTTKGEVQSGEGAPDELPLEPTEELPDDEGSDFNDNRHARYWSW